MSLRTKIFLAAFAVAAASLLVAAVLVSRAFERQLLERIERNLVAEARLAAELLDHRAPPASPVELDLEADVLGQTIEARVTLIGPDGRVVGDSSVSGQALAALENHGDRPEVRGARSTGIGIERRYSTTVEIDLLYVAAPVTHPSIAVVRLALPLTDLQSQVRAIRGVMAVGLAVALAGALALAWGMSTLLSRRVREIAELARRHAAGDLTPTMRDFGRDEIGQVARAFNAAVQELGHRLAELARDRARMDAMLSGMVEGVLVVNDAGRLQLANEAARRMLQLQESPIGLHYLELIRHPDVVSAIGSALAGQAAEGRDLTLHRDPARTFLARAAPVASPGGNGAVLVLHDISELRRADQIRRDFVANVSHELRTPLTSIRGYVEALLDGAAEGSDERGFLEIIARHTSRMERLVRDLLRLARLDAGQEQLEIGPCSIRALFADVITELAGVIDARAQEVRVQVGADATTIHADCAKLHDILRNLVENAATYAPEQSGITLEAETRDGRMVLTVADRGPGIPEADLARVFERFYRVDRSRARERGGTGLGLAIVRHLVGLHDGDVRAANRAGGGAVFTVTLPMSPARRPPPAGPPTSAG
jgi:two-component system phosphate regulon sensor histidine kinase PhoR